MRRLCGLAGRGQAHRPLPSDGAPPTVGHVTRDNVGSDHPGGPTAAQYASALALISAIGLLGIAAGAFALASTACGCAEPADLVVVNQSRAPAGLDWETPGVLGTPLFRAGGHIDAAACGVSSWPLADGEVSITASSADTRTVHVTVSGGDGAPAVFPLIDARGHVSDAMTNWPPGTDDTTTCP